MVNNRLGSKEGVEKGFLEEVALTLGFKDQKRSKNTE